MHTAKNDVLQWLELVKGQRCSPQCLRDQR